VTLFAVILNSYSLRLGILSREGNQGKIKAFQGVALGISGGALFLIHKPKLVNMTPF